MLGGSHDELLAAKHRKRGHVFLAEELALVVAYDDQSVRSRRPDHLREPIECLLRALDEGRAEGRIALRRVRLPALRHQRDVGHEAARARVEGAIAPTALRA